jgi:3-deoxy-D-manno-octulosonic-acid transferase
MPACSRHSSSATSRNALTPEAEVLPGHRSGGLVGEAALRLYGVAGRLAEPLAGFLLDRRERRGKEDAARRGERFGHATRARPQGPLVWIHAASVGETMAVLPLAAGLAERRFSILLTTGTVTAAQVAEGRLPAGAIHQFAPIDTPAAVGRFLDHWHPDLVLFAESELWPTTLRMIGERGARIAVVNARMSERSFRAWRALPPLARSVLGRVGLWLARSATDADRLRALGASQVVVCGNLKFDVPPPPADDSVVASLRTQIGGRPVFMAASTHPGEEAAVIAAHKEVADGGTRLLTILAPRHPERGEALAAEVAAAGLTASRRSRADPITADTDILLADTIGEMGLWYRLADLAFLGGSIVPRGGQNPIEPAKLSVPVLHGAHVENFRDVYDALAAASAVRSVHDAASLAAAVRLLIQDRGERERLARAAFACVQRFTGAADRTLEALDPSLQRLTHDHEAAPSA